VITHPGTPPIISSRDIHAEGQRSEHKSDDHQDYNKSQEFFHRFRAESATRIHKSGRRPLAGVGCAEVFQHLGAIALSESYISAQRPDWKGRRQLALRLA
jgi:hypothetical protein